MQVTLKKAVQLFCTDKKELSLFKYYLKRSLLNTGKQNEVLTESEPVEVQDGVVTIVFTWDNIYAINNISGKYCDLTHTEDTFEVFD